MSKRHLSLSSLALLKPKPLCRVNSLWSSYAIWRRKTWTTLDPVMTSCLTAPSHYQNQCWLIIAEVFGIHLRKKLQERLQISIIEMSLKMCHSTDPFSYKIAWLITVTSQEGHGVSNRPFVQKRSFSGWHIKTPYCIHLWWKPPMTDGFPAQRGQ